MKLVFPGIVLLSLTHALELSSAAELRGRRQPGAVPRAGRDAALQTAPLENTCKKKLLDLVFIIDSSRSVRPYDYEKVKEFIVTILQFLDIGPDSTRVGLLQYGSTVKQEFSLKTYRKKSDMEHAVQRMRHLATGTMTGVAIQYAMNIAFTEADGARPLDQNVPRIAMIVTDGRPQDPVAEIAAKARNTGILIFAIGVGRVDMNTLKSIGSDPHEEHVFLVANFSQIESLTSVFQTKLCVTHLCATAAHGCAHFCINTPGSYSCICQAGYLLNPDRKTCSTQDLCALESHDCEQICVNTPGSYVCQCYEGYELDADGKKCIIVDFCAVGNHGCQHECVNADESYVCKCRQGYLLNPDQKTCRRPDYCALRNHGCQHECINKEESYICKCQQGFTLNPDKKTCKRINYCVLGNHGCDHECVNIEGSFICRCRTGHVLNPDGKTCREVDHCAETNHGCEQLCLNTPESYICQCSEGFVINEDLKTCSRVDYCALTDHGCEHLCKNTDTSYRCLCFEGYQIQDDGKSCTTVDFCALVNPGCEHMCANIDNSYKCFCEVGYQLQDDGKSCKKVDHCALTDHGCEHQCANSDESYMCLCYEGYKLQDDGKSCKSIDVCKSTDHGCEHICVNNEKSYICSCFEGYTLGEDGKECHSIDVCKSTDHGCEHICVNNEKSYICSCFEGYTLREDGKECRRCTEGPIDLVFVIDGSKSLGEDNFEIVKQFVNGILDSLEISPKAARVGLLQYSTRVRTEFTLAQHSSAQEMKKAVSQMNYMGKGSMTGQALKHMFYKSFSEVEGARASVFRVPKVAIVFTDGRAQDDVAVWAKKAKHHGITIYAIGVGKAIEEELREIASIPENRHLFYAEDFSSMGVLTEKLKASICEGLTQRNNQTEHIFPDVTEKPAPSKGSKDSGSCSIPLNHFKAGIEENRLDAAEEHCKCKNIMELQNHANEDVRKLTQQHIL
ncbi:matrilin-2 isoform X2 [Pleurodeles waltl]|uniref:matrilin-2 isoform X2 n=1 Tax=Pleurodeles waltl TaxID=8319 RepID=UPI003709533D